ncbi:MAG TPA: C40 family peptidase [Burkholderiales bacterium]|nr:C40 family peptidase [Burkholderiales bacterium]
MRPALLACLIALSFRAWGWHDFTSDRERPLIQAMQTLGVKYRLGGRSPDTGFDCSGLVTHVFERAWGVLLPPGTEALSKVGTPVARLKELQPGDLVFYNTRNRPYSHVGIYLGEGRFVHAPRPGAKVRVESLQTSYWRERFDGARRLDPPTF